MRIIPNLDECWFLGCPMVGQWMRLEWTHCLLLLGYVRIEYGGAFSFLRPQFPLMETVFKLLFNPCNFWILSISVLFSASLSLSLCFLFLS